MSCYLLLVTMQPEQLRISLRIGRTDFKRSVDKIMMCIKMLFCSLNLYLCVVKSWLTGWLQFISVLGLLSSFINNFYTCKWTLRACYFLWCSTITKLCASCSSSPLPVSALTVSSPSCCPVLPPPLQLWQSAVLTVSGERWHTVGCFCSFITAGSDWDDLVHLLAEWVSAGPVSITGFLRLCSSASFSVLTFLPFFLLSLFVFSSPLLFSSFVFTSSLVSCTWSWPILSASSLSSCASSMELREESFGIAGFLFCSSVKITVLKSNWSGTVSTGSNKTIAFYGKEHWEIKHNIW